MENKYPRQTPNRTLTIEKSNKLETQTTNRQKKKRNDTPQTNRGIKRKEKTKF